MPGTEYDSKLIGHWAFSEGAETADTGLADGVAQDGTMHGDAEGIFGFLRLFGGDDRFEVGGPDAPFDLAKGSLVAEFIQFDNGGWPFQTVISRGEFNDAHEEGYFEIRVTPEGAVEVQHIMPGGPDVTATTGAGFFDMHDRVRASYEWSETEGARFTVENLTDGTTKTVDATDTGLSMDIGDSDAQSFTIGAREVSEGYFAKNFDGKIDDVKVYDGTMGALDGVVEGTEGGDVIDLAYTGDPEGDRIDAGDAIFAPVGSDDDIVEGYGGDDLIRAGEGDDLVRAGDGADTVFGGDGSDTVLGGAGDDVIRTGHTGVPLPDLGFPSYEGLPAVPADPDPEDDRDSVEGGAGDDLISTGDDRDTISGGEGADTIDGGLDRDLIWGDDGDDVLEGGEGSDTIHGGMGDDTIYGGLDPSFPDRLNIPNGGGPSDPDPETDNARDLIYGGEGADLIYGQDDDDTIFGGAGNDTLDGGVDEDKLLGEDDRDLFINVGSGDRIFGGDGGDDFDTLDLTGAGPLRLADVVTDSDGNGFDGRVEFLNRDGDVEGELTFKNIETIIPCFTPGTLIATPRGERRVEELEVGDRVITRDNGIQEIRWVGRRSLSGAELARAAHLQPVLIRRGALGHGLPERDMLVSPQHRVLVASDMTALYFEDREVLVAAKHLVGRPGIEAAAPQEVTYIHFMFDQHEVVLSDGAWTESFQPGDLTLAGIGNAQRNEILELFPELKTPDGLAAYQAARRTLKKHEALLLRL